MGLIRYFANKSIFVNLIAIFVTVTGLFTFFSSPKEIFPEIEFGIVVITTMYPQASPDEIEKLVTSPIEDAIKNVKGVKEINSSSSESLSMIVVQAEAGYDTKQLTNDLKSAVDKADQLPDEAEDPDVFEIAADEFGMLLATVSGGTYADRRETVKILEQKLSKVKGLGAIEKWGYNDKAIWVDARRRELNDYGLTIFSIMNVLGDRNISMPAGNKRINEKEYSVRFMSEQQTASEIAKIIVRSNETGMNIRIANVAYVNDGFEDNDTMFRADGEDAILMVFNKQKGFDAIKMAAEIKKIGKENIHAVSKDVKLTFADDFAERLKDRLNILYSNGLFGASIVIVLLLLFLRPSLALVVAAGLPVALGASFLITNSMGISFNMISLFGYIMVVGMLVDDAIVVGENAYRHMEMGKKPLEAAVAGASEMVMPVIASVSTTIAAFLPLLMVGGMIGQFMGSVPKIIAVALAASVIECFFILPSHIKDFVKHKAPGKLEDRQEHWFAVLREKYGALLVRVLHKRKVFTWSIIGLFFLSLISAFTMKKVFSDAQINEIGVKFEAMNTYGMQDTARVINEMEKKLLTMDKKDVEAVIAYVGYHENMDGPPKFAPNLGQIRVLLKMEDKRKTRDANKIANKIRDMVGKPKETKKMTVDVVKGGPGAGADISFTLTGDTYEEIKLASNDAIKMIQDIEINKPFSKEKVKPAKEVVSDLEEGKAELRFVVDEPKAMRAGINVSQVSAIMRAAIAGLKVKSVKVGGENIDIMVRVNKDDIKSVEDILSLKVPNMMGNRIPLKEIVKVQDGFAYSIIKHKDTRKSVTITGTVDKEKGNAMQVNQIALKKLEELKKKYPGIEFKAGGDYESMAEGFRDLAIAFIVAMLTIYIILATLFNSLKQPLIIMLAIPFGFVGVILTLLIHFQPISFMSFMGFIGLTGVVVNNSLIMTDFFNQLMKSAKSKKDIEHAIIDAAKIRLRPIFLTTITTSAGLLPLAYGLFGGSDPFLQPMALVFGWGLIFATFVTLFIIPSFLVILHNFRKTPEDRLFNDGMTAVIYKPAAEALSRKTFKKKK